MSLYIQKKFSISQKHKDFLESYKNWGYSGQSSIVREALTLFMRDLKTRKRKSLMAQKARELAPDYKNDRELTAFTSLDGEDFYEAG